MNKFSIFLRRHSGTILSIISSCGVVSTAVLSGMATYEAVKAVDKKKAKTKKEKLKVITPIYIPTVLSGVSTIACIVSANLLSKFQQASLASAYALLNSSYKEYRNKLKELHGDEADLEVISNIASEKFPEGKIPEGCELFYDQYSKRYFSMPMEDVIFAVYNLNRHFAFNSLVTVNEFYDFLQISKINGGDIVGWSWRQMGEDGLIPWIDVHIMKALTCDGKEYYVLDFDFDPIEDYDEGEYY